MNPDSLQGKWYVVSVEVEGQKFPPGDSSIAITGDRFVSLGMGAEYEGSIEIGEKTFDLQYDKGPHAGKTSLGIYELKGDEWKMCLGFAGAARPTEFLSRQGTGHALQILRRRKEDDRPNIDTESSPESSGAAPTELEGEWSMTSCIQDGQPMPKSFAKMARRLFAGNRTTLFIGEQVSAQSRTRVHGGEIDYLDLGQLGRYELAGDVLKISMGEREGPRPADFSAVAGGRRTVTEWKLRPRNATVRS